MEIRGLLDPAEVTRDVAEIIRPPRRISVSEAASSVVRIETPGGYNGQWDPGLTPYMIEPMDMLKSRVHDAVVLVSPARSGKTQGVLDGWLAHCVTADPGDIGMYFSTQTLAHDYRKRRIERLHRYSPQIGAKLSKRAHDTTIEMIVYRHGMILNLGWPSSSQLAQRDLRYVAMSDYDSFPDDIGGEGSPFDLARKRIQVAMSAGMALVESSPKRPLIASQWQQDGDHEAPPVDGGILPLYNRGDRRRWHWQCVDGCNLWFEAPALPNWIDNPEISDAAETASVNCPHCGVVYGPEKKRDLNSIGRWVPQGCHLDEHGIMRGTPRKSRIASFWLLGCAAAFQNWSSIVSNYLQAQRHFDQTGDETALSATTNTDQGLPYRPASLDDVTDPSYLDARREERLQRYHVPDDVRFLLASVDVQNTRFEIAVWGYGPGRERWLVDRYALRRTDEGDPLQPAYNLEHWDVLTAKVINATYQLSDDRELRIYRVAVDSGGRGEKGGAVQVTSRAYAWWRKLRREKLAHRVWLLKGDSRKTGAMVKKSYPDSSKRSDRKSGSAGDVPVLMLRTDAIKDMAHLDLQRDTPGPGYIHLPEWISESTMKELTAERRETGGWRKIARRNETWDLLVYADALWIHEKCDAIDWDRPPPWAAGFDRNSECITKNQRVTLQKKPPQRKTPSSFGKSDWSGRL